MSRRSSSIFAGAASALEVRELAVTAAEVFAAFEGDLDNGRLGRRQHAALRLLEAALAAFPDRAPVASPRRPAPGRPPGDRARPLGHATNRGPCPAAAAAATRL